MQELPHPRPVDPGARDAAAALQRAQNIRRTWNGLPAMKMLLPFCLLFVAAFASAKDTPEQTRAAEIELRNTVDGFMREYDVPGVAIAVTVKGTDRYYTFGVGSRTTGAKVTPDTLFEVGSISKTFTATLAAYAQVNGQLSLTDTPGRYLPELKGRDLDKATLINLGTHTAGGFPLQVPAAIGNERQLITYLQEWKPQYPIGTQRTYANPNIGVLGMATASAMRMPFRKAMEDVLLRKLGLSHTYLVVPPAKMPLYAQGYDDKNAPVRMTPGMLWEPTYGIKTSARDLLRYVEINLDLVRVQPGLARAIDDTRIGYYRLGEMTQDLVWEQLPYPVSMDSLLASSSAKVVFENNAVEALTPPLPPQSNVLVYKTGATKGFGAYVAFNPSIKIGVVLLLNRNVQMEARLRLARSVLDAAARLSP
jgi:beta-lactamase class C